MTPCEISTLSPEGKPRSVAPYPCVDPLHGPIAVEGVNAGDILAVHLLSPRPARDRGVTTVSPNFGMLSGTRSNPNLQPEIVERVRIRRLFEQDRVLRAETVSGMELPVPFRPSFGTIGGAPAHCEVRLSVTPGDFGGNLDLPDLGPGATLYLRANVDGGCMYPGDGHYAQGDGKIAGTAVAGAPSATLVAARLPDDPGFDWPRIETGRHIGIVGGARPLKDAVRIAAKGMVEWIAELSGSDRADSHESV